MIWILGALIVVGLLIWGFIGTKDEEEPQQIKRSKQTRPKLQTSHQTEETKWEHHDFEGKRTSTNLVILPECGDVNIKRVKVDKEIWAKFIMDARSGMANISIEREPQNPFDENAIAVFGDWISTGRTEKLGYLPAGTAKFIAKTYRTSLPIDVELKSAGVGKDFDSLFISVNVLGPRAKERNTHKI